MMMRPPPCRAGDGVIGRHTEERKPEPGRAIAAAILLIVLGVLGLSAAANPLGAFGAAQAVGGVLRVLVYGLLVLSAGQVLGGVDVLSGKAWVRTLGIATSSLAIAGWVVDLFSGAPVAAVIIGVLLNGLVITSVENRDDVLAWRA